MRMYLDKNVEEMARERIRYLLNEFEHVVVNVSGGKDSAVCFYLTYEEAKKMGELPITVFWLDQEFEYQASVDLCKYWFEFDGVDPLWLQIPKRLPNPFSQEEGGYMWGWNPDKEDVWIREKDPMAVHENKYIDYPWHFEEVFGQVLCHEFDPETTCSIGGVRTEESPLRYLGVTQHNTYKGITWGTMNKGGMPAFYPIYDWTYSDEWKFLHDNDYRYHPVYDFQYQMGVSVRDMRCGNLNSELASKQVERLQQFEPETWDKFTTRWPEVRQAQKDVLSYLPSELPDHFTSWREYRNYLLEKVIEDETHKQVFKREFFNQDLLSEHLGKTYDALCRSHCRAILKNDVTSGEVLENAKQKVAYPENAEVKKRKKQWLKENGYWETLREEGVVGPGVNAKLYNPDE